MAKCCLLDQECASADTRSCFIPPVDGKDPLESTIEADVYLPPFDKDFNPLNHTSPHNHPPASFVEAAARAASPADTLEDDEEEEGVNLEDTFSDLVGEERSGLDDLSYSSAKDNKDCIDDMEEAARQIEYSDSNNVRHGRRQTNFIPGGPKPPSYNGMNAVEKVMEKRSTKKSAKNTQMGCE